MRELKNEFAALRLQKDEERRLRVEFQRQERELLEKKRQALQEQRANKAVTLTIEGQPRQRYSNYLLAGKENDADMHQLGNQFAGLLK